MTYTMLVAGLTAEAREQLDQDLDVAGWSTPDPTRLRQPKVDPNRDPAAPAWYRGDEVESQEFLAAVGIELD